MLTMTTNTPLKPSCGKRTHQTNRLLMPTAPLNTKCRELGCHNPKTPRSTFCDQHGGGYSETTKANGKLYNQRAWAQIRARELSKHPLCAACLLNGRVVSGEHIDHVFPHRREEAKFHRNIFQTLCASCHSLKTNDERKGIYKHYTQAGIVEYTGDDYWRVIGSTT